MMHITKSNFEKKKIPLPPLEVQKQIVEKIEQEQKLIEANKKLKMGMIYAQHNPLDPKVEIFYQEFFGDFL